MEFCKELSLSEILDEPIIVAVMARDGVDREHVQHLMDQMRRRLRTQQEHYTA